MSLALPRYALDIESDTTINGLDPAVSFVRSIAILGSEGSYVAEAKTREREPALLLSAFDWLTKLDPGVVVTWNGSCYDLPFLADRLIACGLDWEVEFGIRHDPTIVPKYEALPGHLGGYRATSFAGHDHADIAYGWKAWAEANGVSWSLKPVCEANGIKMIVADRAHIETLTTAELLAYNLSDVFGTDALAVLLGDKFDELLDSNISA